jgi:hypothetical protein
VACESDDFDDDVELLPIDAVEAEEIGDEEKLHLREEALAAAAAEGLTLHTGSKGFVGVHPWAKRGYRLGGMTRGPGHGFYVRANSYAHGHYYLGSFVTAEEAALCYARNAPDPARKQARAEKLAQAMTAEEAKLAASDEGLVLVPAPGTRSGFKGVSYQDDQKHAAAPYSVGVCRAARIVKLGSFVTAEEAALHYARFIGPEEAAKAAKAAEGQSPSECIFHPGCVNPSAYGETAEESLQLAADEGLTFEPASTTGSGYRGVYYSKATIKNSRRRPYVARLSRHLGLSKGKHLGSFSTAEQAALCYARAIAADPTAL